MHNWAIITVSGEPWEVSADAVMVEGQRITVTYHEALGWAECFGGRLPTAAMVDARWQAADLKNDPHTQNLGNGENDAARHSAAIDADVARFGQPAIVGNVGKHWVEAERGGFPLYGWHVDTPDASWRGIKLHPSASGETTAKVIQPYSPGAHPGGNHKDYSSTLILARRPGIPQPADTIPCIREPWQDPALSRGQRAVEWSRSEMADGVTERSNLHRINQYLDGCLRKGQRFGLVARPSSVPNWCAASACFGDRESCLPDEQPFLPWVCSGLELQSWAEAHGVWVPGADVASGKYDPSPGDVVILGRGETGGWERHVCRWICRDGAAYSAIGGNEQDGWRVTRRVLDASNLLGIIAVPDTRDLSFGYDLTADLERRANELFKNGDDPMSRVQALIDATDDTVVG